MPLKNSRFRIIHRLPIDPHGVEGYFIHEIYVQEDLTVTGWRAGVTIGARDINVLKDHVIRAIEAFNHEPISYKDLSTHGFKLPTEDGHQLSESGQTTVRILDKKSPLPLPFPGNLSNPDFHLEE
jgi:hypothetical protein